jgi:hypothetical protein
LATVLRFFEVVAGDDAAAAFRFFGIFGTNLLAGLKHAMSAPSSARNVDIDS